MKTKSWKTALFQDCATMGRCCKVGIVQVLGADSTYFSVEANVNALLLTITFYHFRFPIER